MVKIGKKMTKYVLGVVPGDAWVDLSAVKALMNGTYVSFASPDIAERLARYGAAVRVQSGTGIGRRPISSAE
jgi:prolyl-tRNA editing enzyme YbaK/EbsC (Cys-tRNA(Pro) deacylase)